MVKGVKGDAPRVGWPQSPLDSLRIWYLLAYGLREGLVKESLKTECTHDTLENTEKIVWSMEGRPSLPLALGRGW